MSKVTRIGLGAFAVWCGVACGSRDEGSGTIASAITPPGPTDIAFPAVGRVVVSGAALAPGLSGGCTASLIADRVVLFAAHCLLGIAQACLPKNPNLSMQFIVAPSGDVTAPDVETIPIDDAEAFPGGFAPRSGTCPVGSRGNLTCSSADPDTILAIGLHPANDVALAYLSRAPSTVTQRLRVITSVTETRELSSSSHFLLDANAAFRSVLPTVLGFDGREQRSSALFELQGTADTYPVVQCDGSAVSVTETGLRLISIGADLEHGDSGGPVVVHGGQGQNAVSELPPGEFVIGTNSRLATLDPNAQHEASDSATFGEAGPWIDEKLRDWDGDSVEDAIDNCPTVANPAQANCSFDAEIAWNVNHPDRPVEIRGDACDPVPCPESNANEITATRRVAGDCGPTTNAFETHVCIGREIHDRVDVAPVGAHSTSDALQGGVGEISVPFVVTAARFCEQNAPDFDCFSAANTQSSHLDAPEGNALTADRPWHRISLGQTQCARPNRFASCRTFDFPRGQSFAFDYGPSSTPRFRWDYQADDAFWHANAVATIPGPGAYPSCGGAGFGPGTCLDGRLWLFGRTPVGSDAAHSTFRDKVIGAHGVELSSHYFPARPDKTVAASYGSPRFRFPFFLWRTLPDPPFGTSELTRFDPGEAFPLISEDGRFFAVRDSFEVQDITALIGPGIAGRFLDPELVWLHAIEPSPFSGRAGAPLGVAIARDATSLAARVVQDGLGLEVGGIHDPNPPPPRTDFHAVYSRVADSVFVAGGFGTGGQPLGDAWRVDVENGTWTELPVAAGTLGRVLSAVYTWTDKQLWILDELRSERRLVRVDVASGEVQLVASVRIGHGKRSTGDLRGLLVDIDGAVLLYASSEEAQQHRLARIAPGGEERRDHHVSHLSPRAADEASHRPFDVRITPSLSGALALEPIVDLRGYRFVFEPHSEGHAKHNSNSNQGEDEHDEHHQGGDEHPPRKDAAGLRVPSLPFHHEGVDGLGALLE